MRADSDELKIPMCFVSGSELEKIQKAGALITSLANDIDIVGDKSDVLFNVTFTIPCEGTEGVTSEEGKQRIRRVLSAMGLI